VLTTIWFCVPALEEEEEEEEEEELELEEEDDVEPGAVLVLFAAIDKVVDDCPLSCVPPAMPSVMATLAPLVTVLRPASTQLTMTLVEKGSPMTSYNGI
jgi:hypothetical protein